MRKTIFFIVGALFLVSASFGSFAAEEKAKGRDILFAQKGLPYGFESALPEIHGFLSTQFWSADTYIQGDYADKKGSGSYAPGESTFLPHSFYVDIIAEITPTFFVEGEFEMYKGEKGQFKVGANRAVWHPSSRFVLSIGRQFVLLGSQELVYYPTSKYRLFTWQPFLYERFLRFTGWWDTGIAATGRIPFGDGPAFWEYGIMVSNGPGDYRTSDSRPTMRSTGYVYEAFNSHNRQSYDNNDSKPVTLRLGFSPIEGLLARVEWMKGKYDTNDDYDFDYITSEIFYSKDRLDSVFGFLYLKHEAPADTAANGGIWPGGNVKQMTWYLALGYKIINKEYGWNFIKPVFRIEYANPNMDAPSSVAQYEDYGERYGYTIGLNLSPWEHFIVRLGYKWVDEETGPNIDNDGFTLEAVVDF